MLNMNQDHQPNDSESGFSNIRTHNGDTVRIFALSAEEFERAKPGEEVFRRVAAIMAESKSEATTSEPRPSKNKLLSNEDRIRRIVQG